jgi:hypothetical protein
VVHDTKFQVSVEPQFLNSCNSLKSFYSPLTFVSPEVPFPSCSHP